MALFGRKEPEIANDDENENVEGEENQEEQSPQFATVDQMQQMIEAQGVMMKDTLTTLLTPTAAPAVAQEPTFIAEVNEDDILTALEEGDNKKVLALQRQQRQRDKQISEHQMNQLRQEGSQWIGSVNQKMAQEKLPDYNKYEREINTVLSTFPADVRSQEQVIQFVYNSVRGSHMDEEVELKAKQLNDEKKRQANLELTGDPSPGARRHTANSRSYEEDEPYFSREVDDVIRAAGRSHDEQAKKLGYESWAAYEAMAKEYDEKPIHRWATGGKA